jgi:uncharacterized phage-like protein YoqJ
MAGGPTMIVAGTGHRPKFLPCKYNEKHPWLLDLKKRVAEKLIEIGATDVISGAAIGYDTWLAQVAIELNLKLHCYIPFVGQEERWPKQSRKEYQRLVDNAYAVHYISTDYSDEAFLKRDREMVNDAHLVLALWNPKITQGGTYYTVKYAEQKGKKVINLWRPE